MLSAVARHSHVECISGFCGVARVVYRSYVLFFHFNSSSQLKGCEVPVLTLHLLSTF
jgi:hypothetical protein